MLTCWVLQRRSGEARCIARGLGAAAPARFAAVAKRRRLGEVEGVRTTVLESRKRCWTLVDENRPAIPESTLASLVAAACRAAERTTEYRPPPDTTAVPCSRMDHRAVTLKERLRGIEQLLCSRWAFPMVLQRVDKLLQCSWTRTGKPEQLERGSASGCGSVGQSHFCRCRAMNCLQAREEGPQLHQSSEKSSRDSREWQETTLFELGALPLHLEPFAALTSGSSQSL